MESVIAMLRAGGFCLELTHHALHALASRLYGFTHEVFDDSGAVDPDVRVLMARQMAGTYPESWSGSTRSMFSRIPPTGKGWRATRCVKWRQSGVPRRSVRA